MNVYRCLEGGAYMSLRIAIADLSISCNCGHISGLAAWMIILSMKEKLWDCDGGDGRLPMSGTGVLHILLSPLTQWALLFKSVKSSSTP